MRTVRAGQATLLALLLVAGCNGGGRSEQGSGGGNAPIVAGDSDSHYLNAMPPGSNGNSAGGIGTPVPGTPVISYAPHFNDALALYGDLAYAKQGLKVAPCNPPKNAGEHVAESDLVCNYYKHEGLTPDSVESSMELEYLGRKVKIERDGWGVPFITGEDRVAAMYGFGYASAQDRLWLHDALRNIGRGRFSEFLGPASTTYDFDVDLAAVAGYSEEELTTLVANAKAKFGSLGDLIVGDLDAMVDGINAYIDQLILHPEQIPPEYLSLAVPNSITGGLTQGTTILPKRWTRNDIVASAILIQSIFANGGGGEHLNTLLLQRLDPNFKPGTNPSSAACQFWRDVRHADDPDATRTISESFPTQSPGRPDDSCRSALPAGVATWDVGSFQSRPILTHAAGGLPVAVPTGADNAGLCAPDTLPGIGGQCLPGLPDLGGLPIPGVARAAPEIPLFSVQVPLRAPEPKALIASLDPVRGAHDALAAAGFPIPYTMSNFIGVPGSETESGHPIVVMGPQAAYFVPQLLWEVAIKSNGGTPLDFAGRGVVFGDLPYINIGRGQDFAFSATSGSSDITDIRVSKMCNLNGSPVSREDGDGNGFPDADGYLYDIGDGAGMKCRRFFKRVDTWTAFPTAASVALGGQPVPETVTRYILRTHYGPVFATATVDGAPVAISRQRSTFFAELETAPPFALLTTGVTRDAQTFQRLFNSMTGTFNWLYVDGNDVGFIHSGLFPKRSAQVHPDLPSWGDGRYEWGNEQNMSPGFFDVYGGDRPFPSLAIPVVQGDPLKGYFEWPGYLSLAEHPQVINPPRGTISSWNNSPAAGWWSADNNGTYGATHRVDMLEKRLQAFRASGKKHTIASMGEIAADAAFVDLRGQELLPLLLELMQTGTLSADQQAVVTLMRAWLDEGSHQWIGNDFNGLKLGAYRRDRDHDGVYDQRAAVVLMDAWYPHLIDELMPQLVAQEGFIGHGRYDAPRAQGSAYQEGWFQHMKRTLQMVLNTPGHSRYAQLKCADGTQAGCRAAVLTALSSALADLGGIANKDNWDGTTIRYAKSADCGTAEACDAVEHTSFAFTPVAPIHWTNRPTFQQLIEITNRVPR